MIQLVFIRHGEAETKTTEDFARKLTSKGQQKAKSVAQSLSAAGIKADIVLSSDAARTRETTSIIQQVMGFSQIAFRHSLYLADLEQIQDELVDAASEHTGPDKTYLLIGHNPSWSEMTSILTSSNINLKPGDACVCTYQGKKPLHQAILAVGQWQLKGYYG